MLGHNKRRRLLTARKWPQADRELSEQFMSGTLETAPGNDLT